jgi:outer membrane protein
MRAASRSRPRGLASVVAAVALSLLLSAASPAQTTATRIGYVDTQRIIRESELFTVGRERLTDEFSARTQVLELEEVRLRELEARRDREIGSSSSQEALELKREIETLERSITRRRSDMKQAMNRRINELSETIDQRIQEEIGAYAREQGIDLVLTAGVGFAHPRLDITDAILKRVNAHAAELRQR